MHEVKPLILFIDAYDSFSQNIISLVETHLHASVKTIKIDNALFNDPDDVRLFEELKNYAAVICGPGPGHPAAAKDVGVMERIWTLSNEHMLPVLGVCLGFQSLVLAGGGQVRRLKGPQHGMIRKITHAGASIFGGVGEVQATAYHSLCGDIGQDAISEAIWDTWKWELHGKDGQLRPLAWAECGDLDGEYARTCGIKDKRVLMAVQHTAKPFWGLQYHPESICTNQESIKIITNWYKEAQNWNRQSRLLPMISDGTMIGESPTHESLLHQYEMLNPIDSAPSSPEESRPEYIYLHKTIALPEGISVPEIIECLQDMNRNHIVLDSSNFTSATVQSQAVNGRYSIVGLDIDDCLRFEYTTGNDFATQFPARSSPYAGVSERVSVKECGGIWPMLAHHIEERQVAQGNVESPFWGGFMGYTTYELGLEGIDVQTNHRGARKSRPDLCFAWVSRSLVVDHREKVIYLQQLTSPGDQASESAWMDAVAPRLEKYYGPKGSPKPSSAARNTLGSGEIIMSCERVKFSRSQKRAYSPIRRLSSNFAPTITQPRSEAYESKVRRCQDNIRAGDSYELCLTDQTAITRIRYDIAPTVLIALDDIVLGGKSPKPHPSQGSWALYKTLRKRSPAPFASYLRLGGVTLISSSPERFLTWDRDGACSLRPMKGTVRKIPLGSPNSSTSSLALPPPVTLAEATVLLEAPKEIAENLMIVDLVRHDLHSVCGSGSVTVPSLMAVEEYAAVYQMTSTVNATLPPSGSTKYTGIDVLSSSLPPGSMTGAPKKRSCEILQDIEDNKARSMYSGVVGYVCVSGRGDFSVTIRSAYRWDDENEMRDVEGEGREVETWKVGAGGAVTILSTAVGEREEMATKLGGVLGVFR